MLRFFGLQKLQYEWQVELYLQIYVSKKWGFTKYERDTYEKLRDEGRLAGDGCNVKYRPEHGPLESWKKVQVELVQMA